MYIVNLGYLSGTLSKYIRHTSPMLDKELGAVDTKMNKILPCSQILSQMRV